MVDNSRPDDLPEFDNPPINELVLGVQFAPQPGYSQIHAGDVWRLFKDKYPLVQEYPALQPVFETFGQPTMQQSFNFELHAGGNHDRFWFMTQDGSELLQFQQDRFLHNWREVPGLGNPYPRFEVVFEKFRRELLALADYFKGIAPPEARRAFTCNQAEISYVNHIHLSKGASASDVRQWLNIADFQESPADDFAIVWRRVLKNESGKPYARFFGDVKTGLTQSGESMIVVSRTVRGIPSVASIGNVAEFLRQGREIIVREFAKMTTESAHKEWGRR